ncbi:MAG: hypothetical protein DMD35_07430 [Gemmatimonadetes bacterium]|nr:MAG: hypothetical protein DMD35_07430 [Gemmatimonadota bacterium]HMC56030.1 hypothetical protein [Gemmatimonadaceae bacterium]
MDSLPDALFRAAPEIRYVALYRHGELQLAQRPALRDASATESDRYEELLVNPALLVLTRQRGSIDCGGLEYVLVRYGRFFQLVHPVDGGHVSVAIEPDADLPALVDTVRDAARAYGLLPAAT